MPSDIDFLAASWTPWLHALNLDFPLCKAGQPPIGPVNWCRSNDKFPALVKLPIRRTLLAKSVFLNSSAPFSRLGAYTRSHARMAARLHGSVRWHNAVFSLRAAVLTIPLAVGRDHTLHLTLTSACCHPDSLPDVCPSPKLYPGHTFIIWNTKIRRGT